MERRQFLKNTTLISAPVMFLRRAGFNANHTAALTGVGPLGGTTTRASDRPNMIVIVVDDLGWPGKSI
jgi:hypothetical protein